MNFLPLRLALHYLSFKDKDKNIAFMVKICFAGIMIGTFSLMLTLIITNGFEKVIHEKMQGINSEVIISSPGNKLAYKDLQRTILDEFNNDVKAVSARSVKQAILDSNDRQSVIFLEGIDGPNEVQVSTIATKIKIPLDLTLAQKNDLLKNLKDHELIIGEKTASFYNINVGGELTLLIPEPTSKKRFVLQKQKFKVVGIFNIGLEEYDSNFAFCNIETLNKIFNEEGVDQLVLKLEQPNYSLKDKLLSIFSRTDYQKIIIAKLQKRLPGLQICSWKDLYPALVASLKLEKYVMFFILALISLVACMNMISLLFMQIQQKLRDIAILKAVGMANNQIRWIFLCMGIAITFFASIFGLGLAALAGYFLEKYPFIELPDVYYVSYLPARMDLDIFIIVFFATMLLGLIATWIPSRRTKQIKIAQVLRQE
jgi:lipoprotein-releasing system permease protein